MGGAGAQAGTTRVFQICFPQCGRVGGSVSLRLLALSGAHSARCVKRQDRAKPLSLPCLVPAQCFRQGQSRLGGGLSWAPRVQCSPRTLPPAAGLCPPRILCSGTPLLPAARVRGCQGHTPYVAVINTSRAVSPCPQISLLLTAVCAGSTEQRAIRASQQHP